MDFVVSVEWLGLSTEKNYQQNVQILRCLIRKLFFKQKLTLCTLVICSLLITYNQFKDPISCNLTGGLKGQEPAINSICWNANSANLVENPNITVNDNNRIKRLLNNYNRTNWILAIEALLIYMSIKYWSKFLDYLRVDIEGIEELVNTDKSEFEYGEYELPKVISSFDSYIRSRKPLPTLRLRFKYDLILFSFSKILFTLISFGQLFFLDYFIGDRSILFGVEVLIKMWHGENLSEWSIFPRDAICNIGHDISVHCDLAINQFNDKIFIFLWFCLLLLSIINLIDLISWIRKFLILLKHDSYTYMRNRVNIDLTQPKNEVILRQFVETYLGEDVVFTFRLISLCESVDLIISEILSKLFDLFVTKHDQFLIDLKRVQEIELKLV